MRNPAFWIVAIVALLVNLFALYDLYMTLAHDPIYLRRMPLGLIVMIDTWPEWRLLLWVVGVFIGLIGAVMFLLRRAYAGRVFWAAALFMALGFGYDLVLGSGAQAYSSVGIAISLVLIAAGTVFALYARGAARHGLLR